MKRIEMAATRPGRRWARGALLAALAGLAGAPALAHGTGEGGHPRFDAAHLEATAFGQAGDSAQVRRVVRIEMRDDMRFSPARVNLRRGETVRFVVHNAGHMLHEMVLGTPEALRAHAALMKKFPGMEHADPNMAHVQPGRVGEIVWAFTQPGEFEFACLQPGHFEAGMIGKVVVK